MGCGASSAAPEQVQTPEPVIPESKAAQNENSEQAPQVTKEGTTDEKDTMSAEERARYVEEIRTLKEELVSLRAELSNMQQALKEKPTPIEDKTIVRKTRESKIFSAKATDTVQTLVRSTSEAIAVKEKPDRRKTNRELELEELLSAQQNQEKAREAEFEGMQEKMRMVVQEYTLGEKTLREELEARIRAQQEAASALEVATVQLHESAEAKTKLADLEREVARLAGEHDNDVKRIEKLSQQHASHLIALQGEMSTICHQHEEEVSELQAVQSSLSASRAAATHEAENATKQAAEAVQAASKAEAAMREAQQQAAALAKMHEGSASRNAASLDTAEAVLRQKDEHDHGHNEAPEPVMGTPQEGSSGIESKGAEEKTQLSEADSLRKQARTFLKGPERQAAYGRALSKYQEELTRLEALGDTVDTTELGLALYGQGVVLRKLNRDEEAVGLFQRTVQLDPLGSGSSNKPGAVWDNLGTSLLKLARFDEAIAAYQQAIKTSPGEKNYERGLQQAVAHREAAQLQQEKVFVAQQAKIDADKLNEAMQNATMARLSAEQELQNAKKRAMEAEQMADTALTDLRRTRSTSSVNKPKGIHEFEFILEIGSGASAAVWASKSATNKPVAVKAIEKNTDGVEAWRVVEEKEIMESLDDHPYVVTLEAAYATRTQVYFVLEYAAGGDLWGYVESQGGKLGKPEAQLYGAELTLALGHLHASHVAYRDLKPENILVGADGHVRLTDFGLSRRTKSSGVPHGPENGCLMSVVGTPVYMAPEMLLKQGHGYPVDWWALGVLLCEMVFGLGQTPFEDESQMALFKAIIKTEPEIPAQAEGSLRTLLVGMLNKDPQARFGLTQVQSSAWMSGIAWGPLEEGKVSPLHTVPGSEPATVLAGWYKQKQTKEKHDAWGGFTEWHRDNPVDSSEDASARQRSGVEELRSRAVTVLQYVYGGGKPAVTMQTIKGILLESATLILQGEVYRGPEGLSQYRNDAVWKIDGIGVALTDFEVKGTRMHSTDEVAVSWSFMRHTPGEEDEAVSGTTVFKFTAENMIMSASNSIKLPLKTKGHPVVPQRTSKGTGGTAGGATGATGTLLSMMMQRSLDFAHLEEAKNVREVELGIERLLEDDADISQAVWGIDIVKAQLSADPLEEDYGMSKKLHVAIKMWGALDILVARKVQLDSVSPIADCVVRVSMRLTGRLKNDPRTMTRMQGLTYAGKRIQSNAELSYHVLMELTFDATTAKVSHVRRYWCQSDVLLQLHAAPRPPESLWEPRQLQAQREAAVDIATDLTRASGPDCVDQLSQVLSSRVVFCVPDVVAMIPGEQAVRFRGSTRCKQVLEKLKEALSLFEGSSGMAPWRKTLKWNGDCCTVMARVDGKSSKELRAHFKSHIAEKLGEKEVGDDDGSVYSSRAAVELVWSVRFEPNSALISDLSWRLENYADLMEALGLLPNFSLYRCLYKK